MLSISTTWNYDPEGNVRDMLSAVKEVGLDAIELGYRTTREHLEQITLLLKEYQLQVSSVHNFCPLPYDAPSPRHPSNYYRLSALDEEERMSAVQWTHRAIDTAVQTEARVVVIHAGTIEMQNDRFGKLLKMCKQGKSDLEEFHALRDQMLELRSRSRGPFLESVKKSLREIMPYAQEKNIIIGLETRYYPTEIPDFTEIGELLNLFASQGLKYWHDIGHAEVNNRLGITAHQDYLKSYENQLVGFHIHNIKGILDHQAPFSGDYDISEVYPYMKDYHLKVIESHSNATPEQIKEAVEKLKCAHGY